MKTIVEKITKEQLNTEEGKKIIGQAGDFLKEGGLVAFPTETVYGLGADALIRPLQPRFMRQRADLRIIL